MRLEADLKILLPCLCLLLSSFTQPLLAETADATMLSNTCAGCHGTNGSSVGPASPSIAGISEEYFIDSMKDFKKGTRPGTIMTRIAKGYSDEEIKLMAGFFSKQKMIRYKQQTDAKKVKHGRKLHKKYCEKCHEDGGRSSEDDAGILAGQWAAYLQFSMDDFTGGGRHMEKKMKKKLNALMKKEGNPGIESLIHFYASQE